ncbi:MAG: O-antigen ligase family protein [Actinomycetota bacterium]|nr:O-antigen ligase family protein [Actinomycetota bacterium]
MALVLGGYLFFGRPFAHVGVPWTPIYVGEALLAAGVYAMLAERRTAVAVVTGSAPLQAVLALLVLTVARLPGDFASHRVAALQDAAVCYYTVFAVVVACVACTSDASAQWLAGWYRRAIPWLLAWIPVAVLLSRSSDPGSAEALSGRTVPGTDVALFGFKAGDLAMHAAVAVAFLWLCDRPASAHDRLCRTALTALGLGGILVAGSVNRGGLLTGAVVICATVALCRERKQLVGTALGSLTVVLALTAVSGVSVDVAGRDVSLPQLAENARSIFDADVDAADQRGTVEWRLEYWSAVAGDVWNGRAGPLGYGFGTNLADRYGFQVATDEEDQRLRNAHNSHLSVMARLGLPGFAVWTLLWFVWLRTLWRARRSHSSEEVNRRFATWLLIAVAAVLFNAVFDPILEGPQVAIWTWTLFGVGCAVATGRKAAPPSPVLTAP